MNTTETRVLNELIRLWTDFPSAMPKMVRIDDWGNGHKYIVHAYRTTPAQGASDPMDLDYDEIVSWARDAMTCWLLSQGYHDFEWGTTDDGMIALTMYDTPVGGNTEVECLINTIRHLFDLEA